MLSDFSVITHRFDSSIRIYPLADVHYGSVQHQQREWERFLNTLISDKNAYVILNGDLLNNNTKMSIGSPYEDFCRPREQKRAMVEYLEPIRDRILCMCSGNHERRNQAVDNDITYDIACKLDIEHLYRENACFLKVGVGTHHKNRNDSGWTYTFCVTHGTGGGIYGGATLNRNERFGNVIDGLDCIIVGHTHKGQISRPSKLVFDTHNDMVVPREYLVVSCVSWMDFGGYALQKMLLPSATAKPQVLTLEADRHKPKHITIEW